MMGRSLVCESLMVAVWYLEGVQWRSAVVPNVLALLLKTLASIVHCLRWKNVLLWDLHERRNQGDRN